MTPKLAAERGPNGTIACVQRSCRHTLPGAWRMTGNGIDMAPEGVRWLFLGFGWRTDDGRVWRVSDRAKKNADFMAGRRGDARRHNVGGPLRASEGADGFRPWNLPITAVCPRCETPQRLDPDVLEVDRSPHEHQPGRQWTPEGMVSTFCCADGHEFGRPGPALLRYRLVD